MEFPFERDATYNTSKEEELKMKTAKMLKELNYVQSSEDVFNNAVSYSIGHCVYLHEAIPHTSSCASSSTLPAVSTGNRTFPLFLKVL